MENIFKYAEKYIQFYQKRGYNTKVNDEIIQKNIEELLNPNFLRCLYHNQIKILRSFGNSGIYLKSYWLKEDLYNTYTALWERRKKVSNINESSRFCDFFLTFYQQNTLINPKPFHKNDNRLSIGKDQLTPTGTEKLFELLQGFNPEWIQIDRSVALWLLGLDEKFLQQIKGLEIRYVEIKNFIEPLLVSKIQRVFHCPCRQILYSDLFGPAFYENDYGRLEVIKENVEVDEQMVSTKINKIMPILNYPVNFSLQTKYVGSENLSFCVDLLFRPLEFINERIGKIVKQVQIVNNNREFFIKLGLNEEYYGWQQEIISMYYDYLMINENLKIHFSFN